MCNVENQFFLILIYFILFFRFFEPDPMLITSMPELETCEKFLMEALSRVDDRKVSLFIYFLIVS